MDKVEKRFLLALIGLYIGAVLAISIACGGGSVTTPNEPQKDVANVSTPPAVQPNPPTPFSAPAGAEWEGKVGEFGSWTVTNRTSSPQPYTAYYTDFDNQAKVLGQKSGTFQPNDSFTGTFNKSCIQVDVTQGAAGAPPFLYGFIDHEGKVVAANQIDRKKCGGPECIAEWIELQREVITGEWGPCQANSGADPSCVSTCARSRTITTIIKEKNTCTNEIREKSRTSRVQSEACVCPSPTPRPTPTPTPRPTPTPTPLPSFCYYEVDCGNQVSKHTTSCPSSQKASLCAAQGGAWGKWNGNNEHCKIALPGVCRSNFQLTPGQSAPTCLKKQDCD